MTAQPVPTGLFKKTEADDEKEKADRSKAGTEAKRKGYEDNTK